MHLSCDHQGKNLDVHMALNRHKTEMFDIYIIVSKKNSDIQQRPGLTGLLISPVAFKGEIFTSIHLNE